MSIKELNDLFKADLIDMKDFTVENKDSKYILVVNSGSSKCVYFKEEITQTKVGLEFFNKNIQVPMRKYKINHYNTYREKKVR